MNKKGSQKGSLLGKVIPKLTKTEKEVLHLITEDFLTVKKIAQRRKVTTRAIYKIRTNLIKKGALSKGNKKVHNFDSGNELYASGIRSHGFEWNIKILWQDERYDRLRLKSNSLFISGHTVRLFSSSVEVYGNDEASFFGEDVHQAQSRAFNYWNRFFIRLEHDLKVDLVKPRKFNIRLVKNHFALINNGLAKEVGDRAEHIKVYAPEDGKLWFLIDNSFNLHEAETIKTDTAKSDMQNIVAPFFNDLRDHFLRTGETLTLSSFLQVQAMFAENIVGHLTAINTISSEVKELSSVIREFRESNDPLFFLKSRINSFDDLSLYSSEVSSLSVDDKELFGFWLLDKFGSR